MIFLNGLRKLGEEPSYVKTNFIAMTARVGSTALVSGLQSIELSKGPIREIFNPRSSMKELLKESKATTLIEYLNYNSYKNGENGLTFKTNWMDFFPIKEDISHEIEFFMPNIKYIYVYRRDPVAQAYSLWKANAYNIWHRPEGSDYSSPVEGQVPLEGIKRNLISLKGECAAWEKYFSATNANPLRVAFEDIVSNFSETVSEIYGYFTGRKPAQEPKSYLTRSSDEKDMSILQDIHFRLRQENYNDNN